MKVWKRILSGRLLPCVLLLLFFLAALVALAIFLPQALHPLAAAERLFSLLLALRVAVSRIPAESKARRLLILFVPWIGIAAVLTLRPDAKVPLRTIAPVFEDGVANAVSQIAYRGCGLAGCHAESAEYFPTGKQMQDRLLKDLDLAEHEILLDY